MGTFGAVSYTVAFGVVLAAEREETVFQVFLLAPLTLKLATTHHKPSSQIIPNHKIART